MKTIHFNNGTKIEITFKDYKTFIDRLTEIHASVTLYTIVDSNNRPTMTINMNEITCIT